MRYTPLLLPLCALPVATQAQDLATPDDPFYLGEIVLFANQTETEADRVGVVVETLDETTLEQSVTPALSETLTRLPGVSGSSNGGVGKTGSVRIRGLADRYVAVRINGIDVADPSSVQTQYSWSGLAAAGFGRVEILKGSQSAIYGSEAIGGAINITSFRPTEEGTSYRFGAEVGRYDTGRAYFSIGQKTATAELAFTLSHVDTDGFSAADENDGNTERDGYTGTAALLSARFALGDRLHLGLEGIWQDEETNIDAFGGAGGDADRPFFTDTAGLRLYAEYAGDLIDHELSASHFRVRRADPNTAFGSPTFEGTRDEVRYQGSARIADSVLTFGAEYSREESQSSTSLDSYDTTSVFGEYRTPVSRDIDLTLSARGEDNAQFGNAITGRAALAWRMAPGTVLRASLGTGYRAPSLNELFGPFNFTNPNPDLEPEESRSAEVSLSHRYAGGAEIAATAFYIEVDNLIGYRNSNYAQTPGTSRTRGIELSARMPVSDGIELFGNYTYTDSRNPDGTQQARVPEHDLTFGLDASFGNGWNGQIVASHIAGRVDGFPVGPVEDYTVVHAAVGYDISPSTTVYARVENLTGTEYQTSAGFGTSDRAFYFGIRAAF